MFERFTTDARGVVLGAVVAAGEQGSPVVGTEHLLLALAGDEGPAGAALRAAGATEARLRAGLAQRRGSADGVPRLDPDALAAIGIDMDEVRRAIEESFGPGALAAAAPGRRRPFRRGRLFRKPPAERGHRRFTAESKLVLERAVRETMARRDRQIGTEHVLLGLLGPAGSPPVSAATGLLAACGIELDALRAAFPRHREAG